MDGKRRGVSGPALWTGAVVAFDQLSKWAAASWLGWNDPVPLLGGVVQLTLARNPGGAFGILSDLGGLLTGLTVTVVAAISLVVFSGRIRSGPLLVGLILIAGGALGNLIDRIRWGYVIDFLDVGLSPSLRWPTFNLADAAIVLGVALALWHLLGRKG